MDSQQYAKHGAVMVRNSGGRWNALQPGTLGQLLKTKGQDIDPIWQDIIIPITIHAGAALTWVNPGTAYTEVIDTTYQPRYIPIPFGSVPFRKARLFLNALGNEAAASPLKGFSVYTQDGTPVLIAEITWGGSSELGVGAYGSWNALAITTDKVCLPKVKAATATEDISIYQAFLELMV